MKRFALTLLTVTVTVAYAGSAQAVELRGKVTGHKASMGKAYSANVSQAASRVQRAQRIAETAWDVTGRVEWVDFKHDPRTQSYGRAYGAADPNTDIVMLNTRRKFSWGRLCTVVLHEYGHLAEWTDPVTGDVHSSDPFSLMYAEQFPDLHDDGVQEHLKRDDGRWVVRRAYDPRCR
jgi:hypothetical protein